MIGQRTMVAEPPSPTPLHLNEKLSVVARFMKVVFALVLPSTALRKWQTLWPT